MPYTFYGDVTIQRDLTINRSITATSGTATFATATATTVTVTDNSTNIATTAFVKNQGYATTASSTYVGTTSVALNRASASQTLTGVSVDGNAATVTNGVYTTGSYSDPSWITSLSATKLSGNLSVGDITSSTGQLTLNSGNPLISMAAVTYPGPPTFTTRTSGTRIVLYPSLGASSVDDAIGLDSGNIVWFSTASSGGSFKWYAGTSAIAILFGNGALSLVGTIGASNFSGSHSGTSSGTNTGDQTNITGNAATATYAATVTATDNSTAIATTAFVKSLASNTNPVMNGTTTIGTSTFYARADHIHPTDTSLAPLNSPNFTGSPTAPTVTSTSNSTAIATTAFVKSLNYAPLASPTFTGNPTAPTLTVTDNSTNIATTAFVNNYVSSAITNPLVYKGTVNVTAIYAISLPVQGALYRNTTSGAPGSGWSFTITQTWLDAGDYVIYNGSTWDRVANTEPSVQSGANITVTPTGDYQYSVAISSSPAFTGTPYCPTISATDNSTAIATTAFVKSLASSATPLMDGTATVGTSTNYAREGHIHPTDTSRQAALGYTAANDTSVVHLAGTETITGAKTCSQGLTINTGASNSFLTLGCTTGTSNTQQDILWFAGGSTGATPRWAIYKNATNESGSNVGSDLVIDRYNDAGSDLGTAFSITRSTGIANFNASPTVPTPTTGDNSTQVATTAFVKNQGYFSPSNDGAGSGLDADLLDGQQGSYYAPLASPTFTGTVTIPAYTETINSGVTFNASGTTTITWTSGTVVTLTATGSTTFVVNGAVNGKFCSFTLILTNGGIGTITWMSSTKWQNGNKPGLTASGLDILNFFSTDGGTTWVGCLALSNVR